MIFFGFFSFLLVSVLTYVLHKITQNNFRKAYQCIISVNKG
jgi:hypothetical protein